MPTVAVELYYDSAWNVALAYSDEGWKYRVGPSLTSGIEPNNFEVTLANPNLEMDPSYVPGALYRKIGRNTPARLSVGGTVVSTGEASSWQPMRTVEHTVSPARGRSWTDFEASGILRRLGRWEDPLRSPLARQTNGYTTLRGYWRMEDSALAQNLANDTAGGAAGQFAGAVTLGADGAGGANSAIVLGSDGALNGRFLQGASYSGYQLSWAMRLDAVPGSGTYIAIMQWTDTHYRTWYWRVNNIGYEFAIHNPDNSVLASSTVTFGAGISPDTWIRYRMKVTVSGSTITYEPAWYPQDAASVVGTSGTFAAGLTTGMPIRWDIISNTYTDGAAYGHLFLTTDTTLDIVGSLATRNSFNGFNGELAGARFTRLMTENSIAYTLLGTSSLSAAMGRQPPGTLIKLLEQIIATEDALIYDDPSQLRLVCRLNNHMIGQSAALALTYGTNLAPPLKKIIDDQKAPNDITGVNWDGTEVRIEDSTSILGTQAPPLGVGRYTGRLDASFRFPDGLENRVNWELKNNTLPGPRYQAITVDLLAHPSVSASIAALRPGDLITLAGVELDTIFLIVINIERSGGTHPDKAVLNCLPGEIYANIGTYDASGHKYDLNSCTLSSGINTSTTSIPTFQSDPNERWRTSGGYNIQVGPEIMTVSSATAGAASGTGWAQTLTVTRGVNGIQLAGLTGDEVHVSIRRRYTMRSNTQP